MNIQHILLAAVFGLANFSASGRTGTFWHISDLHWDVNYTTSGDPLNMCWSSGNRASLRVGEFGDYECDAPYKLITSALDAMLAIQPNPDFILWTGDDTAHVDDSNFSEDIVAGILGNLTALISGRFPQTLVIPILGNHDLYPKNQLSEAPNSYIDRIAVIWQQWLDDFNATEDFHMKIPDTNVSVLALNTLLWYQNNQQVNETIEDDPNDIFLWMTEKLEGLKAPRKAYLAGHIPPGSFERYQQKREGFHWYRDNYNAKFIQAVQNHSDAIEGQFYGHHHTDSFRIFYESDGVTPCSYALLTPGVTPWRSSLSPEVGANNPGVRLIDFDMDTAEILEVTTYYLNLERANNESIATWQIEYKMTEHFFLNNISAFDLHNFFLGMQTDDLLFSNYYEINSVMLDPPSSCNASCKTVHLCSVSELDYSEYYDCNVPNQHVLQ